jgi:hypothetical protein
MQKERPVMYSHPDSKTPISDVFQGRASLRYKCSKYLRYLLRFVPCNHALTHQSEIKSTKNVTTHPQAQPKPSTEIGLRYDAFEGLGQCIQHIGTLLLQRCQIRADDAKDLCTVQRAKAA